MTDSIAPGITLSRGTSYSNSISGDSGTANSTPMSEISFQTEKPSAPAYVGVPVSDGLSNDGKEDLPPSPNEDSPMLSKKNMPTPPKESSLKGIPPKEEEYSAEPSNARQRRAISVDAGKIRRGSPEQGSKIASLRIEQFSQYFKTMENRVSSLERLLEEKRSAKASATSAPSTQDESKKVEDKQSNSTSSNAVPPLEVPKGSCIISDIRRCSAATFEKLLTSEHYFDGDIEVSGENNGAQGAGNENQPRISSEPDGQWASQVEILVDEASATKELGSFGLEKLEAKGVDSSESGQLSRSGQNLGATSVQRVRLRGQELLEIIADIDGNTMQINKNFTKVFVYPFSYFCVNESTLREEYEKLGAEVEDLVKKVARAEGHDVLATDKNSAASANSSANEANPVEESRALDYAEGSPEDKKPVEQTVAAKLASKRKALEHLEVVIKLLDTDLRPVLDLHHRLQNTQQRTVAFKDLWHLFKHGDEVRSTCDDGGNQIYRLWDYTGGRELMSTRLGNDRTIPEFCEKMSEENPGAFFVECLHYIYDGALFSPSFKLFCIRKYDGEREVTTLPVHPLRFDGDLEELRERFIARGKRFTELSRNDQAVHKNYYGISLGESPEEIDSEVIVDTQLALLYNKSWIKRPELAELEHDPRECTRIGNCAKGTEDCCGGERYYQDYLVHGYMAQAAREERPYVKVSDSLNVFGPDEWILFPCYVFGFVLRTRKWAIFKIDAIKDVDYDDSFEDLVLREGHKDKIQALVANHLRKSKVKGDGRTMDVVRGKGKGLIILLHGEPGVGKTSSAECIASYLQRPLFPITCGDLGETAALVEDNLEKNFQLAQKWGCVLLLDEADIFLAERTRHELQRNAIVSVFLRTLEYYSGILFLTTNRVGAFDPAFKSRIHLSLFYPRLDYEATMKVWSMHIDRTNELFRAKNQPFKIKRDQILDFAKKHFEELSTSRLGCWNGRQIRNAFQTAIALAEYKAQATGREPVLTADHFEDVAKASREFDDYLRLTLGMNEQDKAHHYSYRYDAFEAEKRDSIAGAAPRNSIGGPIRRESVGSPFHAYPVNPEGGRGWQFGG